MDLKIPGLSEAMGKLDKTNDQMDRLCNSMDEIVILLREQNDLLKKEG